MTLLIDQSRNLITLIILAIGLTGILSIVWFYRKYRPSEFTQGFARSFDHAVECQRFRSLMLKLYEMQIITEQEHFIASPETVYFNIRDIYPYYCLHYPAFFPSDKIPSYSELLTIVSEDPGYYGSTNMFFQKAAYRPSVAMKRFSEITSSVTVVSPN